MLLQYSTSSVKLQFRDRSARGIAGTIEAAIRTRALAPGDPLPSVREIAAAAAVSPATAAAGLGRLRRRGLIVTRERRRSHVSPRPPLALGSRGSTVPAGVRDLASGHPDPALLPDLATALARVERGQLSYDDDPVLPELAELARADFAEAGVEAGAICIVGGALDGVERVLAAHLAPGDRVAVEDPCYSALLDLVRAMGFAPVAVPIDEHGLLPKQLAARLAAGVDAVVLTPRAQNPTGAALDQERANELARVLDRYRHVLVLEDDHQGRVAGGRGDSVVGEHTHWARVRSVTKALGPDLRLAFVTGDATTASRVEGRLAVGPGWVSGILQRLVVDLLRAKGVQATLAHASRLYRERREALLDALAEQGIAATGRSGFNVWVPVADEAHVTNALLQRGWAVTPGAPFRIEAAPGVRVTTATLEPAEGQEFAASLSAVLAPAPRRRAA
jgi:DNA-binding transcriptional MocR family regulator